MIHQAPVTSGRSIFLTSKSNIMLTAFIIWLVGAIVVAILVQGNIEHLEEKYGVLPDHTSKEFYGVLACSWVLIIAMIVGFRPTRSWWQFPIGKHYIELEKSTAYADLALLVLAGVGCFLLIHGINTYCILSNISIFIIVLVSFFAAIHPIKAAKRLFWTILALVGPMTLDFILHLTITISL